MSIYDELGARVNENRLAYVDPVPLPGSMRSRQLYVSISILSLLLGPWKDDDWSDRCSELELDFDRYVTGQYIAVRLPPSKDVEAFMAQLEPPEKNVWEIRSRDPEPQIRILGFFAGKDCFVGLLWRYRSQLNSNADWDAAMDECKAEWRKLFPVYDPPNLGASIHDYLSKNIYPV